jgi:dTDP-4-dehydrorhamnose 3,5-epimerase-like enzyme
MEDDKISKKSKNKSKKTAKNDKNPVVIIPRQTVGNTRGEFTELVKKQKEKENLDKEHFIKRISVVGTRFVSDSGNFYTVLSATDKMVHTNKSEIDSTTGKVVEKEMTQNFGFDVLWEKYQE